ncbi:MAG: glycosyltransferase family 4 protein, partial [Candidatus Andersenbacteria bacterium]|nr:glycosyltransferase family 4 protein [Candidatus Andersenbacteria bacterium]
MAKPNILFITRACRANTGGMERLSFELTQEANRDQNITTTVIAYSGHRLLSPLFNFTCLPRALRAARQADVVHIGDPMLSFVGWLFKTLYKKPIAVTVHGLDVTYPNLLYQLYLTLFFKTFDAYLPISHYTRGLLKNIPAHKIHVINPGIYDQYYNPGKTRADLDNILHMNTGDNVVLVTSGRLTPRKGHAWFVKHVLPQLPNNTIY